METKWSLYLKPLLRRGLESCWSHGSNQRTRCWTQNGKGGCQVEGGGFFGIA